MTRAQRRQLGKPPLDLIEEAVHLLRTAPALTFASYFVGTLPFVLGLLYFWTDMSRSPFANRHLAEAALGLALLFAWMKTWQTIFARRLRAQLAGGPMPRWTLRHCRRVFITQTIVQPTALFALPIAAIALVPFGWVYGFYQNVTALDDGEGDRSRKVLRAARKQAMLWPLQNHGALFALAGFGLYVFLNCAIVCFSVPGLAQMLFGIESIFTQSPMAALNTTFFAAMFALTFLCVDPILKAVYVLRCFYGESLQSGDDLKAELRQFTPATPSLAATFVLLLALAAATPVRAADENSGSRVPGSATRISQPATAAPADLDHAIDKTIHERKYTWRMPRAQKAESDSGESVITKFFRYIGQMIRRFFDWLEELLRKLFRGNHSSSSGAPGDAWITFIYVLLFVVLGAVIIALVMLLLHLYRKRSNAPKAVATEAIQPAPDLADENVGADQLPEDGWTRLARELLERGEFRLAMRAFYLASLSHLAGRNLIHIERFKSNRDYSLELDRRAHSFPELRSSFGENVSVFERIWYGMHEVNRDLVDRFATNVERMKLG